MMIRDMFADDINRKINGVIKVDQAADDVIEQELNEYVITRELKKHFITFFNYYGDAFDQPTADMGVWISGFFGSGKSHFLKMLSETHSSIVPVHISSRFVEPARPADTALKNRSGPDGSPGTAIQASFHVQDHILAGQGLFHVNDPLVGAAPEFQGNVI